MNKIVAIILAGGSGKRMGTAVKKQYIKLKDKEVIAHTIDVFNNMKDISDIIVVTGADEIDYVKEEICDKYKLNKVKKVIAGGKERQDSVWNGIEAVADKYEYVIIHDGARPFIEEETIIKCLDKAKQTGASIVAVPLKDTIKVGNAKTGEVEATPNRETLWSVQTPQIFKTHIIKEAHRYAKTHGIYGTDDSFLVEAMGEKVYIVEGKYTNIKMTTPDDLIIGEKILESK
ncbi:MAG: 2-C-methyl-D-erythritol 4-phosphate cytidylyltransferase [Cellulosilyticaceae bacterium]